MAHVFVSIGSNIDRTRSISLALRELQARYGPLQLSPVYESDAVGFDSAPFYNLVAGFDSDQSPRDLQQALHALEETLGRARSEMMTARTIDLDLLLYDDLVIKDGRLVLPRDDIMRYAFVLRPLAEIAGDQRHPVTGERFADMWQTFDAGSQRLTRVDFPMPGKDTS